MKLVIFTVPNSTSSLDLVEALSEVLHNLNVRTTVNILEENDLSCNPTGLPQIQIIDEFIDCCGSPENKLTFTTNFYRTISEKFGGTTRDVKVVLNELIESRKIPEVKEYANKRNVGYIFDLAANALGMIR